MMKKQNINKIIISRIILILFLISTVYHSYYSIYWLSSKKNDLQNIKVKYEKTEIEDKKEAIYTKKIKNCFEYLSKVDEKRRIYHSLWVKSEIRYYTTISVISISLLGITIFLRKKL